MSLRAARALALAGLVTLPWMAGCSALGLFDAAPAVSCLSDGDCHVAGLVEDACVHYTCDIRARICVGTLIDHDGDGQAAIGCAQSPHAGATPTTDCDDTNGAVHAGATEICSLTDTDCDGIIDEDCVTPHLAVGSVHTCWVAGPDVVCWGNNTHGELGTGSIEPTGGHPRRVAGLEGVVSIAAGLDSTCAGQADGRVFCWGNDDGGQLGLPPMPARRVTPTEVPALEGASAISIGHGHACALLDGDVVCWGHNASGEVGDGTTEDRSDPFVVPGTHGAIAVSAGNGSSCAVLADHTLTCWGLGLRPSDCGVNPAPCAVVDLGDVIDVRLGSFHGCAIRSTDRAVCWGDNTFGQRGSGGAAGAWSPIEFALPPETLSAGGFHSCLVSSGQAWCWGSDQMDQIAQGAMGTIPEPFHTQPTIGDFVDVGAGGIHTCGLRRSGDVVCWGENFAGQLGVPDPSEHTAPQEPLSTWVHDGQP